jgi:hypothetical protein
VRARIQQSGEGLAQDFSTVIGTKHLIESVKTAAVNANAIDQASVADRAN